MNWRIAGLASLVVAACVTLFACQDLLPPREITIRHSIVDCERSMLFFREKRSGLCFAQCLAVSLRTLQLAHVPCERVTSLLEER